MMSNKNSDLEKRLKSEFESITPDNLERIRATVDAQEPQAKILELPKKKRRLYQRFIYVAAALFLVCALGASTMLSKTTSPEQQTLISLDVNPGVELTVNSSNEITSFSATNDDGQGIISDLSVNGKDIEEGIEIIINKLVDEKYISSDANSVLVSVNSSEPEAAKKIENLVTEKITASLSKSGVEATLITQIVEKDGEVEELANEYNMSEGKARLINELVKKDGRHTFEELASLTVNELTILLNDTKIMPDDVKRHGEASKTGYITKEEALQSALKHVGVTLSDVTSASTELDYLKKPGKREGSMIYDVRFVHDGTHYVFDIGAKNGEILKEKTDVFDSDSPPPEHKPRPQNTIGKEMAVDIAEGAGLVLPDEGDFEVELEYDGKGNWYYEIEVPNNEPPQSGAETSIPNGGCNEGDCNEGDCNEDDCDEDDCDEDDCNKNDGCDKDSGSNHEEGKHDAFKPDGDRNDSYRPPYPQDGERETIRIDAISGQIIKQ